MRYVLLIHADPTGFEALSDAQKQEAMGAYTAYTQALREAGALVDSNRLRPASTATTVRLVSGKPQVLNGPYAESREQLGGYFLIEASDLDAALKWAARCPGASHGAVEVRPVWAM